MRVTSTEHESGRQPISPPRNDEREPDRTANANQVPKRCGVPANLTDERPRTALRNRIRDDSDGSH